MDNLDYQILTELKQNARQTASDISKTIHLSVSTVIERIKKMEKSGLIQSYTVICDDGKLGNDITVLMEISMEHPRFNDAFIVHINSSFGCVKANKTAFCAFTISIAYAA